MLAGWHARRIAAPLDVLKLPGHRIYLGSGSLGEGSGFRTKFVWDVGFVYFGFTVLRLRSKV